MLSKTRFLIVDLLELFFHVLLSLLSSRSFTRFCQNFLGTKSDLLQLSPIWDLGKRARKERTTVDNAAMSNCRAGPFKTDNGLNFNVTCDTNSNAAEVKSMPTVDLAACMNECSYHNDGPCFGVTFNSVQSVCSLRADKSAAGSNRVDQSRDFGTHMALANRAQMAPLKQTACPFPNGLQQRTRNGMQFEVYCDLTYFGDDYNFSNKGARRTHTNTMQECLEQCASGRPLCLGVLWNPDMGNGYANCYPKNSNNASKIGPNVIAMHSAIAPDLVLDDSCGDGTDFGATADKTFRMNCGKAATDGDDLASFRAGNFEECAQRCGEYAPRGQGAIPCNAAAYDPTSRNGYENCRLLSGVRGIAPSQDSHIAVLMGREEVQGLSASGGGGAQSGKSTVKIPLVVGTIVGALAVTILLGWLWWRKRRQRRRLEPEAEARSVQSGGVGTSAIGPGSVRYGGKESEVESSYAGSVMRREDSTKELPMTWVFEKDGELKKPAPAPARRSRQPLPYELAAVGPVELDGSERKRSMRF